MPFDKRVILGSPYTGVELKNHPFTFWCDKERCGHRVACKTEHEAAAEEWKHHCPRLDYLEGKDVSRVAEQKLIKIWEIADAKMDQYKTDVWMTEIGRATLGGEMRGIAHALAIVMVPYFNTADEIVSEIIRRQAVRQAGEVPVTPGIGYISFMPEEGGTAFSASIGGHGYTSDPACWVTPPPGYPQGRIDAALALQEARKKATTGAAVASTPTPRPAPKSKFTAEQVEELRTRLAAGFTAEMLAMANDCKPGDIMAAVRG